MSATGKKRHGLTTRDIVPAILVKLIVHTTIANSHPHTRQFVRSMQSSLHQQEENGTDQRADTIMGAAGSLNPTGGLHMFHTIGNGSASLASSYTSDDIHSTPNDGNGNRSTDGSPTYGSRGQFAQVQGSQSDTDRQYLGRRSSSVSPVRPCTLSNETTSSSGLVDIAHSITTDSQTTHFTTTPSVQAVSTINVDTPTAMTKYVSKPSYGGFTFTGTHASRFTLGDSMTVMWTGQGTRTTEETHAPTCLPMYLKDVGQHLY